MAWIAALKVQGLSTEAYIIQKESSRHVDYLLIATGSEVSLPVEVAQELGETTREVVPRVKTKNEIS